MKLNELVIGDAVTLRNGDKGVVIDVPRSSENVLLAIKDDSDDRFYVIRNYFDSDMEYTPNTDYSVDVVERIEKGFVSLYIKIWDRNECVNSDKLREELEEIQHGIDSLKLEISLMKKDIKDLKERRAEIRQALNSL